MGAHRLAGPVRHESSSSPHLRSVTADTGPVRSLSHSPAVQAMLHQPAMVAGAFWIVAAIAGLAVSFTSAWGDEGRGTLTVIAAVCVVVGVVHLVVRNRLPSWAFHAGGVSALALITAVASVGPSGNVNFAILYIWVIVYSALYFGVAATILYAGLVGAAYAGVLILGPSVPNPTAAWVMVFGTGVCVGAVIVGLVGVLRSDAHDDSLTGLPNRRSWEERLDNELERSRRTGTVLSVAVIDLDGFKAVNDSKGHDAGDAMLQRVAHGWQGAVRSGGDFLASRR